MDLLWLWGEAFLRWLHVVAGIAWIGSSFYFIHLDLSLRREGQLPDKANGDAWQVHGGGFYHMVKYLVAPPGLPSELTWFKWEAYATWMSGFALFAAVYYAGANLYLIDESVRALSPWAAIAISIAGLVLGWAIYDGLCRSPVGDNETALALVGFAFLVALAFLFSLLFSGRGAFMQMGAIIGTIMAANVLMVIIPGQRKVVAALQAGKEPDAIHGKRGKQRSVHNNYLTLPVVFVMIAGHYPPAFATRHSWAILALLILMGAVIRHFYNERHKRNPSPWWTWGVAAALGAAIVGLSAIGAPSPAKAASAKPLKAATIKDVEDIVAIRCAMCHSATPQWPGMSRPPKGLVLDSRQSITRHLDAIKVHAVLTTAMPPGNITFMEPEERQLIGRWLASAR